MRLLLIRHGQTPSNLEFLLDTAVPGAMLTELGERQAAALPAAVAEEKIRALYASTLIRTQLTAAPLAAERGLEVQVRDGIREIAAGELEMERGDSPHGLAYMETAFAWSQGETGLRMPGGEDGAETLGRFDAVVAEAAVDGGTVAMVSHGAVIRVWVAARAANVDVAFAAAHLLDNTGVVALEGSPEQGWTVVSWQGTAVAGPAPGPQGGPAGRPVEPPR
ncbi:histidine phosphatase family protein [Streptomyces sp. NPDC058045]|uniref:histidine phosphatase family protein n=1 Tax=Streptomyces sp. NPDC058045 TaxID=3346311 RepID=UPI0036E11F0C